MKGTYLGIDVGGSGIKGALVDLKKGKLLTERYRVPTPQPSLPGKVAKAFNEVVEHFEWDDIIGVGFPSIMKNGYSLTAANIHKKWVNANAEKILSKGCGCEVIIANDADLAGLAEVKYGAGKNVNGTVLLITIGSGLGSGLFLNGELVPNTELGHLYLRDMKVIAERWAADSVRKKEELTWDEWGKRFNVYLNHLELLFSPDLFILGGGGSKKFDNFSHLLDVNAKVVPAQLRNEAGIIGAAFLAHKKKTSLLVSQR